MSDVVADLHLHSHYSDGDLPAGGVIEAAASRGVKILSLTDHNGLWGIAEAERVARNLDIDFIEGIEVSARWQDFDVHVLGYSRKFDRPKLAAALAHTLAGYRARAQQMIRLCRKAGYEKVSWDNIERRRAGQTNPIYMSYDVARELREQHDLSVAEARKLTTTGGVAHVPYGNWALSIEAAIETLHEAQGVAILAHPGLIETDGGDMEILIERAADAGVSGLEVYHPFHDKAMIGRLESMAQANNWLATSGSDWHGPGRYGESDAWFGKVSLPEAAARRFIDSLERV